MQFGLGATVDLTHERHDSKNDQFKVPIKIRGCKTGNIIFFDVLANKFQ